MISDCGDAPQGTLNNPLSQVPVPIEKDQTRADQPLEPVLGVPGLCKLAMSQRDYLDLVDHTGRRIHAGKRGALTGPPPAALARLGHTAERWQQQVLAVGWCCASSGAVRSS